MTIDESDPELLTQRLQRADIESSRSVEYRGDDPDDEQIVGREPATGRYDVDIRVLELETAYAVELCISSRGESEYDITRRYFPRDAESIAIQIYSGEAEVINDRFEKADAMDVSAALQMAADVAGRKTVAETVGEDVLEEYPEGQMPTEVVAQQLEEEFDGFLLEE